MIFSTDAFIEGIREGARPVIDNLEIRMEHPDYDAAVDALAEGVRNQTRLIIDCLGIRVKLADLESWGEYELLRRKMHGGFTGTRLYRSLFPRRYRRLYQAYLDAQLRVQQEFLNEVLAGRGT